MAWKSPNPYIKANEIILSEFRKLGYAYQDMNMIQAAVIVAAAYGLPINGTATKQTKLIVANFIETKNLSASYGYPNVSPVAPVSPTSVSRGRARRKPSSGAKGKYEKFYRSWDWKRLRYEFMKDKEGCCECCGASAVHGIRVVVDHIKPIRKFWHLRLEKSNLQILCNDCNMGKSHHDETDWRLTDEERERLLMIEQQLSY
jgi:5-methylcytosine-specific restriction endonuclease McrA